MNNENICAHKNLYMNIQSRIMHNSQKVNTNLIPINWWLDKQNMLYLYNGMGFPGGSVGEASTCNAGDLSSIPGFGKSPGEGKGYPLQYSGLENSMNSIVHGVTRSHSDMTEWLSLSSWLVYCKQGWNEHWGAGLFSNSLCCIIWV